MADIELNIVDGPTKPDLQWAVAYPDRHLHVHFDTGRDAVDAHVDEMQEMGDGTRFALKGHLTSGLYKGWPFKAVYDLSTRSGMIKAQDPRFRATVACLTAAIRTYDLVPIAGWLVPAEGLNPDLRFTKPLLYR